MSLAIPPPSQDSPSRRVRRRRRRNIRAVPSDQTITPDEIRSALQRLLASRDFPATPRNRRFLAYVVEKTIAGSAEEVSGYGVATGVFGRPVSFNPALDPIVRIEAGKLRRDLEFYYLKSGAAEAVLISLPRGGYVPSFHRRSVTAKPAEAALDPRGITVHALHSSQCALAQAEPSFRARVADYLTRNPSLAVFSGPAAFNDGGLLDSDTVREVARRNGTRFVLSGDAGGMDGSVVLTARLHDGATGRLLWAEEIAGHPATLGEQVASRVVAAQRELAGRLDHRAGTPGLSE